MITQFFTIGILMLLSAMLPGPDFAMVTKNTLVHSRRAGLLTALGIGVGIFVHITYCALGLALVISQSIILFSLIKYVGAAYLIYLGVQSLLTKPVDPINPTMKRSTKTPLSMMGAFRQGFLCNLLNPKATMFFLALFTVIIRPDTPGAWYFIYAAEMFVIVTGWFCGLSLLLSHPWVVRLLNRAENAITKTVGVFLIGFGVTLAFLKKQ